MASLYGAMKSVRPRGANFTQVRTATKRAAGSRTHMKDSAGRRLGPKKQDGELVKTGQILMRQRGTKFYPGENAGIGKDHTIFALEPGYVRYYLDPFHPKRRFIGVALKKGLRLPSSHWMPRLRRFGGVELKNSVLRDREENRLSRKEHQALGDIESQLQQRELARSEKKNAFLQKIPAFVEEMQNDDVDVAADRLLKVDGYLRGGKTLGDAQFYASYSYIYDLKLQVKRGELDPIQEQAKREQYERIAALLDEKISFDAKFRLCSVLSPEKASAMKQQILSELETCTSRAKISTLIESQVFTLSEQVRLRRRYLKPVASENVGMTDESDKKATLIRRWNYEKRKIDQIARSKAAFL